MQLTPEQLCAVQSWQRGDICVVAGPGSGKTRVLVERLRWLIVERRVQPERILAITFTEKAALEMHSRLVGESGPASEHRSLFESAQISTIDAFCSRLLREHALEAGVDPGFEMLDAGEADELLAVAIEDALDEAFGKGGPDLEAFLAGYAPGAARSAGEDATSIQRDLANLVYRIRSYGCMPFVQRPTPPLQALSEALRNLSQIKRAEEFAHAADELTVSATKDVATLAATLESIAALVKPVQKRGALKQLVGEIKDELLPACRSAAASAANEPGRKWLRRLARRTLDDFGAAKQASGRLDFDDALALAADLLGSQDCPTLAFEHILIDEFQDTNPLQVRLVDRLLDAHGRHRPVRFVVGDINQSIYGFRHADQNVFREYRERVEESGGDVIRLLDNFRSRPELLAAVHRLLPGGGSSGVEQHRLNAANQFPAKELPCLEVQIVCDAGAESRTQEALRLAQRLRALKSELSIADRRAGSGARSLRWGDVAILVRTHAAGAVLAQVLRQQGIPCLTISDRGLFQAPETAELAAFLRVVRNPRDEISLAAVLKSPFCGITDAALLQIRLRFENLSEALAADPPAAAGLDAHGARRLARFGELLARWRADRATVPPRFLLARSVAECGYRSFLARQDDSDLALAHVDQLFEWIARKEQQGLNSLDAISAALDQALETKQPEDAAPDGAETSEAVQVLTMHAAKGLEFPVVVLAALQSRPNAHQPGLLFSEDHGIGARWRHPFDGSPVPDDAFARTSADIAARERTEAERLLYVAMTRAEEHLILSATFSGAAQKAGWLKTVFERLGIEPKEAPSEETRLRTAGGVKFLYGKTSGEVPPSQAQAAEPLAEPEVLLPLAPAAQADYSAAVTSVSLFADCPRKYFLSRYLGLESDAQGSWQAVDQDDDGRKRQSRDDIDPSLFGQQVHEHLAGQLADPSPQVRALAERFANHDLGLRADRADRIDREMAFVFTVGDYLLRGTVDLLFEEGGERILVDYKTDNRPSAALEVSAKQYAPQLQLYAAGLAKAHRRVDRAIVFYLRNGAPIDIDVSIRALDNATRLVEEFFAAQRSQLYPLREGAHCRQCPHFRRACPAQPDSIIAAH